MVVKPTIGRRSISRQFESRVILDGSQTSEKHATRHWLFESRVILDGSQTSLTMVD